MKVILHADDFGYDNDTTDATIELLECGVLTSASIMVTMPAASKATAYAAKHPEKSFGVHLTYVDELMPALSANEIPSLVDRRGVFLPSNETCKKALCLAVNTEQIIKESLAQIKLLQNANVHISHLDSHGHLHKYPSFLLALKSITKQSGIRKVRRVQNVFVERPKTNVRSVLNQLFASCISSQFRSTDYFYMSANSMDTHWSERIIEKLDALPKDSIIEIGVHPARIGHAEGWRVSEYVDIKEFSYLLRTGGKHQIITWNEV